MFNCPVLFCLAKLYSHYVLRLQSFLTLDNCELNSLAFIQGAVAVANNGVVMDE